MLVDFYRARRLYVSQDLRQRKRPRASRRAEEGHLIGHKVKRFSEYVRAFEVRFIEENRKNPGGIQGGYPPPSAGYPSGERLVGDPLAVGRGSRGTSL